MALSIQAQTSSCDPGGGCGEDETPGVYNVLAPVGQSSVEMIELAPRLETLEGKTIALVGGSFMASVTHVELKKITDAGVEVVEADEATKNAFKEK